MTAKIASFFPKFFLFLSGISLGIIFLLLFDRALGKILNSVGYFKAINPRIVQIFDNKEFYKIVKISPQGLRNENVTIPKPPGTKRILTLGDSMTFGWGVNLEESWPKILEKKLQKAGKKIEIINAGAPGADLDHEIKICFAYRDRFQIDGLILGFYPLDDLYQILLKKSSLPPIYFLVQQFFPTLSQINEPIIRNQFYTPQEISSQERIFLVSQHWRKMAQSAWSLNASFLEKIPSDIKQDFLNGKINPGLIHYSFLDKEYLTKMLKKTNLDSALSLLEKNLNWLKKCSGHLPLFFLILPSYELVSEKAFSFRETLGFETDKKLLELDLDSYLLPIVEKYKFFYLSPLSLFREENCFSCYYPWDSHLNEKGHQKIADFLFSSLASFKF